MNSTIIGQALVVITAGILLIIIGKILGVG